MDVHVADLLAVTNGAEVAPSLVTEEKPNAIGSGEAGDLLEAEPQAAR